MLGRQPDLEQHLHRPVPAFANWHVGVDDQRLGQDIGDPLTRIERAVGVLENDLDLAAHLGAETGLRDVDLLALDEKVTRGRRIDHRDDAREGRLAAAALADNGQRLALLDLQADALDGAQGPGGAEQAAADMIVADDVAGFEDDIAHRTASRAGRSARKFSSEMVGSLSPTAFSGRAESNARV